MIKVIKIMDYRGKERNIEIKNFENVVKMEIKVLSGDEILNVLYKDYSLEMFDSAEDRLMDFFDDNYTIYDTTKGIDYIENWSKRTSSYDYDLESEEI